MPWEEAVLKLYLAVNGSDGESEILSKYRLALQRWEAEMLGKQYRAVPLKARIFEVYGFGEDILSC